MSFQVVPIESTSMENGNACQDSPEHRNKMYENGGGPADQCSHTFQVLGVGPIRRILGSYRFQEVLE